SPPKSASIPTQTSPYSSYSYAQGTIRVAFAALRRPFAAPRRRRAAPVVGGNAATEDRRRARSLHRRAGRGEEGRRHRGAQPLAARAGARGDPGRDHAEQHHHDRSDGGGQN